MAEERGDAFLRMILRAQRGKLKVYLGYAAGVGKTYQMLQEGHRLKKDGIDIVVGFVEAHGREETAKLITGLEVIPRFRQEYRGIVAEEMDLQAILTRKPQVVLVDELAHTNIPGSKNAKRFEDVQDLMAAGIHVITTLNLQHLESLYNTVEKATGVKVRERLPDGILAEADQIVNVDVTPEDLQERLRDGMIYPAERIETALINFFKLPNLENLREMTLRELAAQINLRRHETLPENGEVVPDQIMVCLSSKGPNREMLLRYASRLAGKLNRNWYAVYVQTPSEEATVIDAQTQRLLSGTLTLAKELGAMVFTYKGEDVAETIIRFAREYRVGHIIIGSPVPIPFWRRLLGEKSIPERLMEETRNITIVVLDTSPSESATLPEAPSLTKAKTLLLDRISDVGKVSKHAPLSPLLDEKRIILWNTPVGKEEVIQELVKIACQGQKQPDYEECLQAVEMRESEGSTFFNDGVAFPHARIEKLDKPIIALGITRQGVTDTEDHEGNKPDKPIDYIFLSITPTEKPEAQIELLALAARTFQNRYLLQELHHAETPQEAYVTLQEWEKSIITPFR